MLHGKLVFATHISAFYEVFLQKLRLKSKLKVELNQQLASWVLGGFPPGKTPCLARTRPAPHWHSTQDGRGTLPGREEISSSRN